MQKAPRTYHSLQACRGVAALLVVLFHLGRTVALPKYFGVSWLAVPFSYGWTGVDFFFVLSGFIISHIHWGDLSRPTALARFLEKRFVRVYPIYWLTFIAVFAFALSFPALRNSVPKDPGLILWALALLPLDNVGPSGSGAPVIVVAWTLQYEVMFYLLFALAIINRWLGVMVVLLLVLAYVGCRHGCTFPQSFVGLDYWWLFGMGVVVAAVERAGLTVRGPAALALTAVILFMALGIAQIYFPQFKESTAQHLSLGLASCLIIIGLIGWEKAGAARTGLGYLGLLGDASYVLYLVHFPLVSILCKAASSVLPRNTVGALLAYLTILVCCLVSALVLHVRLERPLLRALGLRKSVAVA